MKIYSLVILTLFIYLLSCASTNNNLRESKFSEKAINQIEAFNKFGDQFSIMSGQVSLLYFPYYGPFKTESLVCNGSPVQFFALKDNPIAVAYVARSYFDDSLEFKCEFKFIDNKNNYDTEITNYFAAFKIKDSNYAQESLRVAPSKAELSEADSTRVMHEKIAIDAVKQKSEPFLLFDEPFQLPLSSIITSHYGKKRVFNDKVQSQHLGTDFRAALGTDIRPANKGKVVFTGDIFFGGNTIIIDHGLGIFTSYSHLSQISCELGQNVNKDTIIGLSGQSGRVTGPHLHWGALVHGHWVDGISLINASRENFLPDTFARLKKNAKPVQLANG